MIGTHSPLALPFTVAVALLVSYVVRELLRHGTLPAARHAWVITGVASLGFGITSVHFIGMLGYRVRSGGEFLPIAYDLPQILLAAVLGMAGAAAAVAIPVLMRGKRVGYVIAGVLLGGTIAGTHFTAMRAMQLAARTTHDAALSATAVGIALVGAVATALWDSRRVESAESAPWDWVVSALLGAATIVGTHFTAMAAVRLTASGEPLRLSSRHVLATDGLAGMVATVSLLLFGLGAVTLLLERQGGERLRQMERYAELYRRTEAALRATEESERRFRTTAESAPVLIWLTRADGGCEYVNRAWQEYTGRSVEEAMGDGLLSCVHPEDRAVRAALLKAPAHDGRAITAEYRLCCHDGSWGWMLDTAVPRLASPREFIGYIGFAVDITKRKQAEEAQGITLNAARELSASLDLAATLRHVTGLMVPRLADFCVVHLRGADGQFAQVAAEHVDPSKRSLLGRLAQLQGRDLRNPGSPTGRAIATRAPVLAPEAAAEDASAYVRDPEVLEIRRSLAPVSYMVLPLVARGELLGLLTLGSSDSGRRYGAPQLATAELVGARAALAIDNAQLYAEARRAGEEAVRAAGLEAKLMRSRLETLRTQLNPHFLFNALNTLAMLVRRGANPDALRGIVSLSELLRHALSDLASLEVPLRSELALVENYLEIEQLRFRDRLHVSLLLAPDTLEAQVPSLVLQPLVENAIRHGIARRSEAGSVEITSRREDGELVLEVRDDGPGFPSGWDALTSGGIGIANTRERLDHLYDGRARFEAGDAPGGGGLVRVRIPFRTAQVARGVMQ